jgi:hypothetical protein
MNGDFHRNRAACRAAAVNGHRGRARCENRAARTSAASNPEIATCIAISGFNDSELRLIAIAQPVNTLFTLIVAPARGVDR